MDPIAIIILACLATLGVVEIASRILDKRDGRREATKSAPCDECGWHEAHAPTCRSRMRWYCNCGKKGLSATEYQAHISVCGKDSGGCYERPKSATYATIDDLCGTMTVEEPQ